jgi:hypothetical protein
MKIPPLPWLVENSYGRYSVIGADKSIFMDIDNNYHPARKIAEFICDSVNRQGWIPVTERLPKCEEYVYAHAPGTGYEWNEVAYLGSDGLWHVRWRSEITMCNVTHWIPLPEGPKE